MERVTLRKSYRFFFSSQSVAVIARSCVCACSVFELFIPVQ
jgi:hypothetical protein